RPMPFDHDLHAIADGIANLAERFEPAAQVFGSNFVAAERTDVRVEHAAEAAPVVHAAGIVSDEIEGPQLHAADSFFEQFAGEVAGAFHEAGEVLKRAVGVLRAVAGSSIGGAAVAGAAAGVVGADAVASRSAEQLPDRQARRLSEDVPQANVD